MCFCASMYCGDFVVMVYDCAICKVKRKGEFQIEHDMTMHGSMHEMTLRLSVAAQLGCQLYKKASSCVNL